MSITLYDTKVYNTSTTASDGVSIIVDDIVYWKEYPNQLPYSYPAAQNFGIINNWTSDCIKMPNCQDLPGSQNCGGSRISITTSGFSTCSQPQLIPDANSITNTDFTGCKNKCKNNSKCQAFNIKDTYNHPFNPSLSLEDPNQNYICTLYLVDTNNVNGIGDIQTTAINNTTLSPPSGQSGLNGIVAKMDKGVSFYGGVPFQFSNTYVKINNTNFAGNPISWDGRCGPNNGNKACPASQCCSVSGYCGGTSGTYDGTYCTITDGGTPGLGSIFGAYDTYSRSLNAVGNYHGVYWSTYDGVKSRPASNWRGITINQIDLPTSVRASYDGNTPGFCGDIVGTSGVPCPGELCCSAPSGSFGVCSASACNTQESVIYPFSAPGVQSYTYTWNIGANPVTDSVAVNSYGVTISYLGGKYDGTIQAPVSATLNSSCTVM